MGRQKREARKEKGRMKFLRNNLKSSNGQIAIIMIIVIAVALIFYAVTLNLGQFAFSRGLVTIASNTSASMLASDMASYGQALSEDKLGGEREVCSFTGILSALITLVVVVTAVILAAVTGGAGGFLATLLAHIGIEGGVAGTLGAVAAGVGIAGAAASLVLQAAVVQPAISSQWNSIIAKTLTTKNQFTEGAIQSALGKAVTDHIMVPDVVDKDRDRVWVSGPFVDTDGNGTISKEEMGPLPFADTVSRFSMYYSERLRQIKEQTAYVDLQRFVSALEELLYEGSDGWGLYDPITAEACRGRAECTACCVDDTFNLGGEVWTGNRVGLEACELPTDDVYWATVCEPASPYQVPDDGSDPGDGAPGEGYPWIFDDAFENPYNGFLSFRELIGRDDQHRDYYKDFNDPNSNPNSGVRPSQHRHAPGEEGFRLEDATGFYSDPNPIQTDPLPGIYPFFYKMADWGVGLDAVSAAVEAGTLTAEDPRCHWCDPRDPDCPRCSILPPPHSHPDEIPQLNLPLDPNNPASGIIYNKSYVVDGVDNEFDLAEALPQPFPPLAVDAVTIPVPGNIIAGDDLCAQDTLYPVNTLNLGFWKRGYDRFCKDEYPYHLGCAKCPGGSASNCTCDAGTASQFPDDVIDDIVYLLGDFISWAQTLLSSAADMDAFTDTFPDWYPEAAMWIEPPAPPADETTDPPCYLCKDLTLPGGPRIPEGYLRRWLTELEIIRDRLWGWIKNFNPDTEEEEGYPAIECETAWCVPDATLTCRAVPVGEGEDATFDANANGVQGDVEDVVSCLNYNIHGYDHVAGEAFKRCLNSCNNVNCGVGAGGRLPEYHLDGATPYAYPEIPLDCTGWNMNNIWFEAITRNLAEAVNPQSMMEGNDIRFAKCANSCSLADCHRLPRSMVPYTRGPLYWPNKDPLDPASDWKDYQPVDGTFSKTGAPINAVDADGNWKDLTAFNDCLNNCNPANCEVGTRLPEVHSSDGTTPYTYPMGALSCAGWGPGLGNSWYDAVSANKDSITPADEEDIAPMIRCFYDCNTNIADCQSMPSIQTSTGAPYPHPWPALPSTFAPANCAAWGPGNVWYDAIVDNVLTGGGSSCNLGNEEWLDSTRQSAIEAINQVAKFEKRRDFLQNRLDEAFNIIKILDGEDTNRNDTLDMWEDLDHDGILDTGIIPKLEDFLNGPAEDLIRARIDYSPLTQIGLPNQAIYGWRDEDDEITGKRGKWHIVKVEARVPGMCNNACSTSMDYEDGDPAWPRVLTKMENLGFTRCFYMDNTDGAVKFRTTRWDEDKSSKSCAGVDPCPEECGGDCAITSTETYTPFLKFPNGAPLWKFRGSHPWRPVNMSENNPNFLDAYCQSSTLKEFPGTFQSTDIYEGAFIMNEVHPRGDPNDNFDCWNLAHDLLSSGVANETCARYYWHEAGEDDPRKGMGFKFVPCAEF